MRAMSQAEQICEELGFSLEEAQESHERVNEYVATLYLEEEVRTTLDLPGGEVLHKHQLVVGPNGQHYVALDLGDDTIELFEVEEPAPIEDGTGHTGVGFLERLALTYGEFLMEFEAQFAEDGQPVWCY